jgi:V/A-type H+-transporting ATPase subunit E
MSDLLASIIEDAQKQADLILDQARKDAQAIKDAALVEKAKDLELQASKLESRKAYMAARFESQKQVVGRKAGLKRSALFNQAVMKEADEMLARLPEDPGYADMLADWICEGAIELDKSLCSVNFSAKDHVDQRVLDKAEDLIKRRSGKTIKLQIGITDLEQSGVIISVPGSNVSYNNLISSRLRRMERKVSEILEESSWIRQ